MSAAKTKNEKIMALLNRKLKQKTGQSSKDVEVLTKNKDEVSTVQLDDANEPSCCSQTVTSAEDEKKQALRNKAKEKILFEAKRAKDRAEQFGPQGWLKPKSLSTNKEFLRRTIQSTISRKDKKKETNRTS